LQPVEALLHGYEKLVLDNDEAARFLSGMRRRGDWKDTERVMVFGETPHALLGTAHTKAGELIPVRLLSPAEIGETLTQQKLTEID
jgi:tRNA pseudouridine55 synthase